MRESLRRCLLRARMAILSLRMQREPHVVFAWMFGIMALIILLIVVILRIPILWQRQSILFRHASQVQVTQNNHVIACRAVFRSFQDGLKSCSETLSTLQDLTRQFPNQVLYVTCAGALEPVCKLEKTRIQNYIVIGTTVGILFFCFCACAWWETTQTSIGMKRIMEEERGHKFAFIGLELSPHLQRDCQEVVLSYLWSA